MYMCVFMCVERPLTHRVCMLYDVWERESKTGGQRLRKACVTGRRKTAQRGAGLTAEHPNHLFYLPACLPACLPATHSPHVRARAHPSLHTHLTGSGTTHHSGPARPRRRRGGGGPRQQCRATAAAATQPAAARGGPGGRRGVLGSGCGGLGTGGRLGGAIGGSATAGSAAGSSAAAVAGGLGDLGPHWQRQRQPLPRQHPRRQ